MREISASGHNNSSLTMSPWAMNDCSIKLFSPMASLQLKIIYVTVYSILTLKILLFLHGFVLSRADGARAWSNVGHDLTPRLYSCFCKSLFVNCPSQSLRLQTLPMSSMIFTGCSFWCINWRKLQAKSPVCVRLNDFVQ